jgi:DNA-binding transcriptional ArsR family regulator
VENPGTTMSNSVSDFIHYVQSMDVPQFSVDTLRYGRAADEIHSAANNDARLERFRRALTNACAWVEQEDGSKSERLAPVQTLLNAVEHLQKLNGSTVDLEIQALSAMVKSRAFADDVLRAILQRPLAPKDIRTVLQIEPSQLYRVLKWTTAAGLVARNGVGRKVLYSITRLGETALRGADEPAWVQTAALLLELAVEARLHGRAVAAEKERASELSGLSTFGAERALSAFQSALNPSASSTLAVALRAAHSVANVRIEPHTGHFGYANTLVCRALERAGISDSCVQWWDRSSEDTSGLREIALRRPLLSIGNPLRGSLGGELATAFGSLVEFKGNALHLRERATSKPALFRSEDHGVLARFYAPTTGVSYFLVSGAGDAATAGAARVFYERVEEFLEAAPNKSFAVVVRVHHGDTPQIQGDIRVLLTADPHAVSGRTGAAPRLTQRPAITTDSAPDRFTKAAAAAAGVGVGAIAGALADRDVAATTAAVFGVGAAAATYAVARATQNQKRRLRTKKIKAGKQRDRANSKLKNQAPSITFRRGGKGRMKVRSAAASSLSGVEI